MCRQDVLVLSFVKMCCSVFTFVFLFSTFCELCLVTVAFPASLILESRKTWDVF